MSLRSELAAIVTDLAKEAHVRAAEARAFGQLGMQSDFNRAVGEGRGLVFAARRILKRAEEL